MEKTKTVCVIGAGIAGLASIKCLIDAGSKVKCFEKNKHITGRWHKNNSNSIPRSTITNLPSFYSCFSDFPPPMDLPLYFTADDFCSYLELYAKHFDLLTHIQLGCNILSIRPFQNSDVLKKNEESTESESLTSLKWTVTYKLENESPSCEDFDFVMVCTGFYSKPYIPSEMQEKLTSFSGEVVHSVQYEDWKPFENKTTVVCGLGNTGGDIVCDLSDHCHKTYLSTTNGAYILPRITQGGSIPTELAGIRIGQYLPEFLKKITMKSNLWKISNSIYNLDKLCLTPRYMNSIIVNDEIGIRISSGKIKVKPGIESINESTVHFTNGSYAENVNTIVLCTGYQRSFPFLPNDLIPIEKNGKFIPLYKGIFTPKFHSSLAFIGMFTVSGPLVYTMEMQARYAAQVFRGDVVLPNSDNMERSVRDNVKSLYQMYGNGMKEYNIVPNPWTYTDELATDIGCRPSILSLAFTDPKLAWYLVGKYSVHEYRLLGPNSWPNARDAIMSKDDCIYGYMEGSREVSYS